MSQAVAEVWRGPLVVGQVVSNFRLEFMHV